MNVAAVPQRSVLRYPGGKTWLVPQVRAWLTAAPARTLIEPFAGGASVSLCAAAEQLVENALLVELDEDVVAVWQEIVYGDARALSERILAFECTPINAREILAAPPPTSAARAFRAIVRNRVQHGGNMTARAGLLRAGERGNGIGSRWYPQTLARRIEAIIEYRDRLEVQHGDGLEVMAKYMDDPHVAYFIDPPYTAGGKNAGRRLYTHHEVDHERLFELASCVAGDVLMTYDDSQVVRDLAARHGLQVRSIAMRTNRLAAKDELMIGKDLGWCDRPLGDSAGAAESSDVKVVAH